MFYANTYCSFDKIILGKTIYTKGKPKNLGYTGSLTFGKDALDQNY